jgi:hypothetical protein
MTKLPEVGELPENRYKFVYQREVMPYLKLGWELDREDAFRANGMDEIVIVLWQKATPPVYPYES